MKRRASERQRPAKVASASYAKAAGSATTAPRSAGGYRTRLLVALALAGVTAGVLAAHWGALSAQAVGFDETICLFQNPTYQNPGWNSVVKFFREIPSPHIRGYYEPLTLVSLLVDVIRGGSVGHLQPFHQTALVLHVLNTLLIVLLLYSLFGNPWIAAALGLVFGTHGLTVEPVAWVWERKTLLATFFALWTFILYVRYARRGGRVTYACCLVALALSLLSKPTGTPMPVLLLLLDWWPLNRLSRKAVLEKIPFFAITAVSAAITVYSTAASGEVKAPSASALEVLSRTGYLTSFYFRKIAWPNQLSSLYRIPTPLSLSNPPILIGCLLTLAVLVAALVSLRRTRAAAASLAFFLLAIAPTLGLVQFTWVVASDKYVYLPAIGLLIGAAYGLNVLWKRMPAGARWPRAAVLLAPVIIGLLAIAPTRRAVGNWSNTERYSRHMLELDPSNSIAHYMLGLALIDRNQTDEAAQHFTEALHEKPPLQLAHSALGLILYERGQFAGALEEFDKAVRLTPDHPFAHDGRAQALAQLGRLDEAIAELRIALKLRPAHPGIWSDLGDVLLAQHKLEESREAFEKVVSLNPRLPEGQHSFGRVLLELGRPAEAVGPLRAAVRLAPNWAEAHYNLGVALAGLGDRNAAAGEWREALRLNPKHANAARLLEAISAAH
jgi:protein O-mannosyl-transferase